MIFDKLTFLAVLTPNRGAARRLAERWAAAAEREPALVADVIRMSGILAGHPRTFEDGQEVMAPIDPVRLAIDQGRRELGQELLALMNINAAELQQLVETNNDLD